ncbi:MAG: hypothetical protein KAI66_05455 [Lentisphaeria bacterium]|nr:hypothetical protein [Lentisphaeria bacterium]
MIHCALRVDDQDWRVWLDTLPSCRWCREIEISMELVDQEPDLGAVVGRVGLGVAHVRHLLPMQTAPYVAESGLGGRSSFIAGVVRSLQRCAALGARGVSLEMGLDRIDNNDVEDGIQIRTEFLDAVLSGVPLENLSLALIVRYPASFPGSRAWDLAANVVHGIESDACVLALDVMLDDVGDDEAFGSLLRSWASVLGVLRFHCPYPEGEIPGDETIAHCAQMLRRLGWRGTVVFCFTNADASVAKDICTLADQWATLFSEKK